MASGLALTMQVKQRSMSPTEAVTGRQSMTGVTKKINQMVIKEESRFSMACIGYFQCWQHLFSSAFRQESVHSTLCKTRITDSAAKYNLKFNILGSF